MAQVPYAVNGNSFSDQAEASSENPTSGNFKTRVLVELQLQTLILAQFTGFDEDLGRARQAIADSIT